MLDALTLLVPRNHAVLGGIDCILRVDQMHKLFVNLIKMWQDVPSLDGNNPRARWVVVDFMALGEIKPSL